LDVFFGKTIQDNKNGHEIYNRCFLNVAQFKYLGTTVTDQNLIQDKLRGD
jgi:hypothetical protein